MLKFKLFSALISSSLGRVAKLIHLPLAIEIDRHYLGKYLQCETNQHEFPENYPIPPYDDPLY